MEAEAAIGVEVQDGRGRWVGIIIRVQGNWGRWVLSASSSSSLMDSVGSVERFGWMHPGFAPSRVVEWAGPHFVPFAGGGDRGGRFQRFFFQAVAVVRGAGV